MFKNALVVGVVAAGCAMACTAPASATFHLMQVEQIIGGVNGDVTAQAIQLRMRTGGQNLVAAGRIRAWDAAGANPILVKDLTTNVANGVTGSHVLITSAAFNSLTTPATVSDFTMTNVIPASYLAAGSLTFEADGGTIYWRVSWGGAAYTGLGSGVTANDADGNFNPPIAVALPSTDKAELFTGPAAAMSTNNLADYALTAGAAVFTNNAGASFTINPAPPPTGACCLDGNCAAGSTQAGCTGTGGTYQGDGTTCGKVTCPSPCPADVNHSGATDIDDLLSVINAWGPCAGCPADLNGSGTVDIDDLLGVINGWGPCP